MNLRKSQKKKKISIKNTLKNFTKKKSLSIKDIPYEPFLYELLENLLKNFLSRNLIRILPIQTLRKSLSKYSIRTLPIQTRRNLKKKKTLFIKNILYES
jgi:hypothetical protein